MDTSIDPDPQQSIKKRQRSARWIGFFMFIGGGVLGYLSIVLPLMAASRHEEDVSISFKGVVCVPALVIIGLILFVLGNERAGQMFGTREKPSVLGGVVCLVAAGIGILLYELLKSRLRDFGYTI